MRKLLALYGLLSVNLLIGGCGEPSKPSYRSSVELGMTLPKVWMAANQPRFDLINESLNNGCKEQLYRFWFNHPEGSRGSNNIGDFIQQVGIAAEGVGDPQFYQKQRAYRDSKANKYDPYFLTFRDCAIADEAAVSTERKRRADAWLASNPDMAKEVEKVSQEQGLSQTSKETMVELLAPDIYSGLPRPGAGSVLVKIDYDTESVAGMQDQQYRQQNLSHLQRMEELKKQEIQNQQFESLQKNKPVYVRPDGQGGYIID